MATLAYAGQSLESVPFDAAVKTAYDCAVVTTDHTAFDYRCIAGMPLVVDTRNALKLMSRPTIFRL